jgi:rhodanese-related sulfurtransferase
MQRDWGSIGRGALIIMLGSAALGFLANHFSPRGIPIFQKAAETRLPLPSGLRPMTLEQVKAAADAKRMPILDARSPEKYAAGHIPGALNLPVDAFEEHFLTHADTITAAPEALIYCDSEDCGDGVALAERLKEAYQGKLYLFEQGWKQWSALGYPIAKGEAP